jgi:hypothetical protein
MEPWNQPYDAEKMADAIDGLQAAREKLGLVFESLTPDTLSPAGAADTSDETLYQVLGVCLSAIDDTTVVLLRVQEAAGKL